MIGLTADKLLLVVLLVGFLFGPERLPRLASGLGGFVRTLRGYADVAKQRVRDEIGTDLDDIEWKKLDPRQYDPRQIVRTALAADTADPTPGPAPAAVTEPPRMRRRSDGRLEVVEPAPMVDGDSVTEQRLT